MAYSEITYTGDGSTKDFAIPFEYLEQVDISVTVDGLPVSFTFTTPQVARTTTAPASGAVVKIIRTTPIDAPIVDYVDGSTLTEANLDATADQTLFSVQEMQDEVDQWILFIQENVGAGGGGEGGLPPVTGSNNLSFEVVRNGVWTITSLGDTKTLLGIPAGGLGTAARHNTGTSTGLIPLWDDFGSAAWQDVGVGTAGRIPTWEMFGTAAFKVAGSGVNQVPLLALDPYGQVGLPAVSGARLTHVLHQLPYIKMEERQAFGANGGAYTPSDTWINRNLNTEISNEVAGASLAADRIALPAGTYQFVARAYANGIGVAMLQIVLDDGTIVARGVSNFTGDSTTGNPTNLEVVGKFNLGAPDGVKLQMYGTQAWNDGKAQGKCHNVGALGDNIYSSIELWKIE